MRRAQKLEEFTRKDLMRAVDTGSLSRSKAIKTIKYLGVLPPCKLLFLVPSVTAKPPTNYLVQVNLVEYADLADDAELTTSEKLRLSLAGDVKISCNCPAFSYWGYDYIVSQLGTKEGEDQDIYPKVRNPKLNGVMCKHCYRVVRDLGLSWTSILKDLRTKNYYRGDTV